MSVSAASSRTSLSEIDAPFVLSSIAVFTAAMLSRLFFVMYAPFVAGDSSQYEGIAINLLDGNGFAIYPTSPTLFRAPVYPLFIAGVYALFGRAPGNVLVAQAAIGGAAAWIVFLLARRLLPARIAFFGSVLGGVYPHLAYYAGTILSETLTSLFLAFALLATDSLVRAGAMAKRIILAVVVGAAFGVAALTSPYLAGLPVVAAGVALLRPRLRVALVATVGIAIGYGLTLTPWIVRNELTFGRFAPLTVGSAALQLWLASARVGLYDYRAYSALAETEPVMAEWVYLYRVDPQHESELLPRRIALESRFLSDAGARIRADPLGYVRHRLQVVPYLWIQPGAYAGHFRPPFERQNPTIERMLATGDWGAATLRLASIMVFTVGLFGGVLLGTYQLRGRLRDVAVLYAPAVYVALLMSWLWIEHRYSVLSHPFLWLVATVGLSAAGGRLLSAFHSVAARVAPHAAP